MIVKTVDIKPAMTRADLDAQRALFEEWWKSHSGLVTAFHIWQAALAAQAPVQGPYVATNAEELNAMLERINAEQTPVQGEPVAVTWIDQIINLDGRNYGSQSAMLTAMRTFARNARAAIDAARKAST